MIRNCFSVFNGIGSGRERAIRAAGVSSWQDFLNATDVPGVSDKLRSSLLPQVQAWSAALERADIDFFAANLARREQWLLYDAFGDAVRYLDIETTGLSPGYHDVTVVGICDGLHYQSFVRGRNLSTETLDKALAGCKLLVSYYGTAFDVPFLRAAFPDVRWDLPHFDLCFAGRRVGLTGGLKNVERKVGIERDASVVEVDGFEAVRLWRRHQKGDPAALRKLIDYNEADTRNLAPLAAIIYTRLYHKART